MENVFRILIAMLISFGCGAYLIYNHYVPNLKIENKNLQNRVEYLTSLLNEQNNIKHEENTQLTYVPKSDKTDNDIDLCNNHTIKVAINNKEYELPSKVQETSKFENGKLVIKQNESTIIDISKASEEMAELKAKQYSRTGEADVGCIYNGKKKDFYGGIRYNAKAWDVGYYHNVNGNDWLIGLHYKF